ncbi:MAG TPA: twin-arginine translocase TatA/TatE family subunit [Rudaea sp.]|jgi:sec-independent protein translocase protein TatA|nr:twin-arginine translocase TatA/TatE family subunit [Rudaea sp.]
MGTWGIGHWLIVLLIAVLLFGTKKLGNIGGDVASAIKSFRKGLQDDDHSAQSQLKADPDAPSAGASESKRENTP